MWLWEHDLQLPEPTTIKTTPNPGLLPRRSAWPSRAAVPCAEQQAILDTLDWMIPESYLPPTWKPNHAV